MENSISEGWRKSSRCDTNACVEVRLSDGLIQIRDSKDPNGQLLSCTIDEWNAFVVGRKNWELNI